MVKKKDITLNETLICDEYTNSKIGIEALALKHHVELNRFATSYEYQCVGVGGKMF